MRRVALALVIGAALCVALEAPSAARSRALGGVRLVEAMEASPVTVVAYVEATQVLDLHGYAGVVRVESVVSGEVEPGARLSIAWEELAKSRDPRFASDDRVLLVLEPLPGASIWLSRLPNPTDRGATLLVAMRGGAFLRNPSLGSALLLQHYLALTPDDRKGAAGIAYLVQLAESAALPLAIGAVERLSARSGWTQDLTTVAAEGLVAALVRPDSSTPLEAALIDLVAKHQPEALREPLESLAANPKLAPASVYIALARLDGELSPARTVRLLTNAPEPYRRIAVRYASGERAEGELRSILRDDPSALVRGNAVVRLAELRGLDAVAAVADALSDREPSVRARAAQAMGGLGGDAVPVLRRVVDGNDPDAARAAVVALVLTESSEGTRALGEIAAEHEDASLRTLAEMALGRKAGHNHD